MSEPSERVSDKVRALEEASIYLKASLEMRHVDLKVALARCDTAKAEVVKRIREWAHDNLVYIPQKDEYWINPDKLRLLLDEIEKEGA